MSFNSKIVGNKTTEQFAPNFEWDGDGTAGGGRAVIGKKPTLNSSYSQLTYIHSGSAAAVAIKATEAVLGGLCLHNNGATLLYALFKDKATAIANAEVPTCGPFVLDPGETTIIPASYFMANQHHFPLGLTIGISTTPGTYTAHATPADVTGSVNYQ